MKSAVESLSSTRVKLTVEVPFAELKHALDVTYKEISGQIRVPGFRPGKVPARMIDQRVGRGYVLEQAVNHAIPELYGEAVREQSVQVAGQPSVDVTEFADGGQLVFTAEVDVRPEIDLPDYDDLAVEVADAEVTDEAVEEQLSSLRDRFAVLTGVERPAQASDYVSIDLAAAVDGVQVPELATKGLSYEVGGRTLLEGLDDAVTGLSADESATFTTALVGGDHAGRDAEVTVTVQSVKAKELPELDDDFAQTASEFDTLAELTDDLRERLMRVRQLEQGIEARDKALQTYLDRIEIDLPAAMVESEKQFRRDNLTRQLEQFGMTLETYLAGQEKSPEDFESELDAETRTAVKSQLVLDALAAKHAYGLTEAELSEHIVRRAQQGGVAPQAFADQIVQAGQVGVLVGEVLRGKALADILEKVTITDASGRPVDLSEIDASDIDPSFADDELDEDEDEDYDEGDDELDEAELDEGELDEAAPEAGGAGAEDGETSAPASDTAQ